MGEIGEYFDMKERQGAIVDEAEDVESLASRTSSSNFILDGHGRARSHQYYPRPPSPLHFTHLNSPTPAGNAYSFMPSPLPLRFDNKPRKRRRGRHLFCCCCCSLCSVFVTAAILLGLTTLITWLVLRPIHLPRFSLDDVEFQTLSTSSGNSKLNADALFTLTAENPNRRLGFKYNAIGIEASYSGYVFGHCEVPTFSLGPRNVTSLTSKLVVEKYLFTPARLGQNFSADEKLGRVQLHFRASAKVRVQLGVLTSFALNVFVDCDVAVKPPHGSSPSSVIDKTCKLTR